MPSTELWRAISFLLQIQKVIGSHAQRRHPATSLFCQFLPCNSAKLRQPVYISAERFRRGSLRSTASFSHLALRPNVDENAAKMSATRQEELDGGSLGPASLCANCAATAVIPANKYGVFAPYLTRKMQFLVDFGA